VIYLSLGWRLSRAGGGFRAVALVLATALGAIMAMFGTSYQAAFYPNWDNRWLSLHLALVWVILLTPLAVLLSVVGRLSSQRRDQRLAALRLLGFAPGKTALVAAFEHLPAALAGAVLGVAVYRLALPWLNSTMTGPGQPIPGKLVFSTVFVGVTLVALPLLSALTAAGSMWSLTRQPLMVRAPVRRRRPPGRWRLIPFAVGLGVVLAWPAAMDNALRHGELLRYEPSAVVFAVGALTLLIGLFLVVPLLIDRLARASVKGDTARLLAGRATLAEPAGGSRVAVSVGLIAAAALAVTGIITQVDSAAHASVAEFNSGPHLIDVWPQMGWSEAPPPDPALTAELAALPGVHQVIEQARVVIDWEGQCAEPAVCNFHEVVFVGTCDQLAALTPVTGCDETSAGIVEPGTWPGHGNFAPGEVVSLIQYAGEDRENRFAVTLGSTPIRQLGPGPFQYPPAFDLFVPANLLPDDDLTPEWKWVIAEGGWPVLDQVKKVAADFGWSGGSMAETSVVESGRVRGIAALVLVIVLTIGWLTAALAAIDQARSRCRMVAHQVMLGTPVKVLRLAQWHRLITSAATAALVGALTGGVVAWSYVRLAAIRLDADYGERIWLNYLPALTGLVAIALGMSVIGWITLPAIKAHLTPDLLRRE